MTVKDKEIIIGVDLGGTKIMTGAIDTTGNILCKPIKINTGANEDASAILKRITDSIAQVITTLQVNKDSILGIGIGSTGPLDIEQGMILDCPQLPNMQYFPLKKAVETHFDLPVLVNNDANCLILAENLFGIAKNSRNVVGFTLGTGIGCAIIFDQKIYNGHTGTAGEIWTSPLNGGIIEDYVSGEGVSKIYQKMTGQKLSALQIHEQAKNGDENALKTWQEFGKYLAIAISWTINILDPEMVVLGGSMANAAAFFMPEVNKLVAKQVCSVPAEKTKIKIAKLDGYAGFIGAAALFLQDKLIKKSPTKIRFS